MCQVVHKTRSDVHAGGGFAVLRNSRPAMLEVDQVSATGTGGAEVCSWAMVERVVWSQVPEKYLPQFRSMKSG